MKFNAYLLIVLFTMIAGECIAQEQNISISGKQKDRVFGGVGALSNCYSYVLWQLPGLAVMP
jgi:hypothetical protein